MGIQAVRTEHALPADQYHAVRLTAAPADNVLEWLATFSDHAHIRLDCPLFRLPPAEVLAHASYFCAVLDSLRPSRALHALVQKGVSQLHAHNNKHSFTFLHLRIENDWLAHCQRWSHLAVTLSSFGHNCFDAQHLSMLCTCIACSSIFILRTIHGCKLQRMQDGIIRDNCFNNTFSLAEQFQGKGIDRISPLYIASSWREASTDIIEQVNMWLCMSVSQAVLMLTSK